MDIKRIIKDFKINEKSRVPLYYQVYDFLLHAIKKEKIGNSLLLPTEKELCGLFKCSKITIRQALRELELEGFIKRKPGVGTFIMDKTHETEIIMRYPFNMFTWFQKKSNTQLKILRNEVATPTNTMKKIMNLGKNDKVIVIERLGKINNEPISLAISFFPHSIFKKIDDEIILNNSITKIVTDMFKFKILKREILIEADVPNNRLSKLLQIRNGDKKVIQCMTTKWFINDGTKEVIIYNIANFHRSKGRFLFTF